MIERSARFPCRFSVLTSAEGESARGTTVNLSASGTLVQSSIRPRVGSLVKLSVTAGGDEHVLGARVVRLAADGFAVQFLSHPETVQAVRRLVLLISAVKP